MFINPEFFNQLSFNKSSSKSKKKEILLKEHDCELFLAVVFHSWNWSKPYNTKKHSFKIEFFFFLFSSTAFLYWLTHSLCLKIKTFHLRKAYCPLEFTHETIKEVNSMGWTIDQWSPSTQPLKINNNIISQ